MNQVMGQTGGGAMDWVIDGPRMGHGLYGSGGRSPLAQGQPPEPLGLCAGAIYPPIWPYAALAQLLRSRD
jgi:hypothetical protein